MTADRIIKKLMLIFLIIMVSAAGFCGFFIKWSFREESPNFGFQALLEQTAGRPFVHRQLLPEAVRLISASIPEETKEKLSKSLIKGQHIEKRYAQSNIPPQYVVEYYVLFIICVVLFFAAIWTLRSLLIEILHDDVAGTIGSGLFALLFPFFEVLGGYYYDIGEIFFMFLAAKLALRGNVIALFILAPFAEWNKESFLFFLATLFPLTRQHFSFKKSAAITLGTMFIAGLAYLYVRQMFLNNPGDMADWRIKDHLESVFDLSSYFLTNSIYGLPLGASMFLPHVIYVVWIVKNAWHNLNDTWKLHAKLALIINGILYFMFVLPGELRDLSMLYISFILLTSYYIRDIFIKHYKV